MDTGSTFPRGKVVGTWSYPLTSTYSRGWESVKLYLHSPIRLHCVVFTYEGRLKSSWTPLITLFTFSRSRWSVIGSISLAKRGTSKKRPSPYLHKVPTRSNKVSPRIFQTALVQLSLTLVYSVGSAYSTHGKNEKCIQNSTRKTWRDHFRGTDVGGSIILKWFLRKYDVKNWNGFVWFRIQSSDELLRIR